MVGQLLVEQMLVEQLSVNSCWMDSCSLTVVAMNVILAEKAIFFTHALGDEISNDNVTP